MSDVFGVFLTVLLLGANAFFVAAEFALISARRDRLEALAEQGKKSAVTVIRAGQNALADAGRRAAGHHDLLDPARPGRRARGRASAGEAVRRVGDAGRRAAHGVVRHRARRRGDAARAARRDGAEEHRDRRTGIGGDAAGSAVPALHPGRRKPFIAFYNWCANATLRLFGVEPKDELDITVSTVELSEMIAESLSEGLLDPEEHSRLTRALQIRTRVVSRRRDAARPTSARCRSPAPGLGSDRRRHRAGTGRDRLLALPRRRRVGHLHRLPAHQGRAVAGRTIPRPSSTRRWCGRCRACSRRCRCPTRCRGCGATTATSRWSPTGDGQVTAMVTLEDLVEDLVGTVRDGTHRV